MKEYSESWLNSPCEFQLVAVRVLYMNLSKTEVACEFQQFTLLSSVSSRSGISALDIGRQTGQWSPNHFSKIAQ